MLATGGQDLDPRSTVGRAGVGEELKITTAWTWSGVGFEERLGTTL